MKAKVTKLLIKWGNNEKDVAEMVNKNFNNVVRIYPDAKPSFIADAISTLR